MTCRRAQNAWAAAARPGNQQRHRLPLALLLLRSVSLLLLAFLPLIASSTNTSATEKKVLFLYGDKSNGAMMMYRDVFQSTLRAGSSDDIAFYEEYLDFWKFSGEDYLALLRDFYSKKYEGQKFDLIVAQSPVVLSFISKYGEEIFPGTPTVFGAIDKSRFEGLSLRPNITGVLADLPFGTTLETALSIQPDVRSVVVVGGTSEGDVRYLAKARAQFLSFEGRVEFTYLTDLPLVELEKRLAQLPERTIVVFLTLYRDGAGQSFTWIEAMARLAKVSSVPIYGTTDRLVDAGSIGGRVWSNDADATEVAKLGLRVLAGEKPAAIPVRVADTTRYMFNWRQLRRFGIDERRLPPGSMLRFQELSFWELYKWRVVAVILLCIFQALLIVRLLISRSRRLRAEQETQGFAARVKAQHERLEEVVSNVPGIVWESHLQPDSEIRKPQFVSPYVESMLGYSVDEWLSSPDFVSSILIEEDREKVTREIAAVIESGTESVLRFRCMAKDGRLLWVETHVAPMRDEAGKTIGLRGVTLDITERKRDELALHNLSGRLLMLQDEEQRRVAGELHDGLGQSLAIIKNRALIGLQEETSHERARDQLDEIAETATAAILEVREIAHNLRPYQLDRMGLVAAIKFMIKRVSESTSLNISADMERIDGLLSPEAETSIYRIVQEGLNNVLKHSAATTARVEIKRGAGNLAISVEDNGKGISPPASSRNGAKRNGGAGVGLPGITERVRLLGASFAIDSQPGRGTTLTVRLELPSVGE
ncbi:MAG TPA: ABC transporter substrate binding protein [Pyrinomonadaceae bacterium]